MTNWISTICKRDQSNVRKQQRPTIKKKNLTAWNLGPRDNRRKVSKIDNLFWAPFHDFWRFLPCVEIVDNDETSLNTFWRLLVFLGFGSVCWPVLRCADPLWPLFSSAKKSSSLQQGSVGLVFPRSEAWACKEGRLRAPRKSQLQFVMRT